MKFSKAKSCSVRNFLDIDELGKHAMGEQWTKLTPAQQQEFQTTLRELIEANYSTVCALRALVGIREFPTWRIPRTSAQRKAARPRLA